MIDDGCKYKNYRKYRKYWKHREYTLMDDGWWMIEQSTESAESTDGTESIHWWMMDYEWFLMFLGVF